VIRRFQIEDIITQNAAGIVFRAIDTETGRVVAVRRFFPFGSSGGGLMPDEQAAYRIALGRLEGVRHPGLRAVVCGGCDPVDGMPFLATEWVEGTPLQSPLAKGPLAAQDAVELLRRALEVSAMLSRALAEDALWVETGPQSIVRCDGPGGRGFTFWLSAMKWLGGNQPARGLDGMVTLTEEIMGWKGKVVNDQAGGGLGAWFHWLRAHSASASLRDARERLDACVRSGPATVAVASPVCASTPAEAPQPSPRSGRASAAVVISILGLALVATSLAAWLWMRARATPGQAPATAAAHAPAIHERTGGPDAQTSGGDAVEADAPAARDDDLPARDRVFSIAESRLLALRKNQQAILEGTYVLHEISNSGKTIYLYLSPEPAADEARGAILVKDAPDLDKAALARLIGSKVRITGQVRIVHGRPEIRIPGRAAIEVIE
jgi:hypothetical protein